MKKNEWIYREITYSCIENRQFKQTQLALAKKLGVEQRVEFKGYVDHEALPRVLSESDIFIRPSRSEGMGILLLKQWRPACL